MAPCIYWRWDWKQTPSSLSCCPQLGPQCSQVTTAGTVKASCAHAHQMPPPDCHSLWCGAETRQVCDWWRLSAPSPYFEASTFQVNATHGRLVWINLMPWEGLGKLKNNATASIFLKICSILWHDYFTSKCDSSEIISPPKQSCRAHLPYPRRTLGQTRLSESPLSNMALHVCICSDYVLNKKAKHSYLKGSSVEGHLATMRGGISMHATPFPN